MEIKELAELVRNRLANFQLARDYARMNGDLKAMNEADKEIASTESTLYQLNLLLEATESENVKASGLTAVITDGSVAVLDEYDITLYATDPQHEQKILNILSKMPVMSSEVQIDDYIQGKYLGSPVTGEMIMSAGAAFNVDVRLMMAIMEQDSGFGTAGVAVRTLNPGNVGNTDDGSTKTYDSWQAGVTAVADWLDRHRGSTVIPGVTDVGTPPDETIPEPPVITIMGANPAQLTQGVTYSDLGATATDASGNDLSIELLLDGQVVSAISINTSTAGEYTITYRATDSDGQVTEATRFVIVNAATIGGGGSGGSGTTSTTDDTTDTDQADSEEQTADSTQDDTTTDDTTTDTADYTTDTSDDTATDETDITPPSPPSDTQVVEGEEATEGTADTTTEDTTPTNDTTDTTNTDRTDTAPTDDTTNTDTTDPAPEDTATIDPETVETEDIDTTTTTTTTTTATRGTFA